MQFFSISIALLSEKIQYLWRRGRGVGEIKPQMLWWKLLIEFSLKHWKKAGKYKNKLLIDPISN